MKIEIEKAEGGWILRWNKPYEYSVNNGYTGVSRLEKTDGIEIFMDMNKLLNRITALL